MALVLRLVEIWRAFESLVWSVQCCGCGRWDFSLCSDCASTAKGPTRREVLDDETGVPTWPLLSLGPYEGVLRGVVLAAKHDRARDLSGYLYEAGLTLGRRMASDVALGGVTEIWVVPTPASRARQRARTEVVPIIAGGVQDAINRALERRRRTVAGRARLMWAVELSPAWSLGRFTQGSLRGRGARGRGLAKAGSMRLVVDIPPHVRVVVVDDVCASGATLREVIRQIGYQVVAVAVIAVSGNS